MNLKQIESFFPIPSFEDWKKLALKENKREDLTSFLSKQVENCLEFPVIHPATPISGENPYTKSLIQAKAASNNWITTGDFSGVKPHAALLEGHEGFIVNTSDLKMLKDSSMSYLQPATLLNSEAEQRIWIDFAVKKQAKLFLKFDPFLNDFTQIPDFIYPYTLESGLFRNKGATLVFETAVLLAMVSEYLQSEKYLQPNLELVVGIGPDYFAEIARLRALRLLVANISSQCNSKVNIHIQAKTLNRNLSEQDPETNLLRLTTESMSAIIGGCDSLRILPYSNNPAAAEKAIRLSRNIALLLREEALLSSVVDVAAGSRHVEYLTNAIATESWKEFQAIESKGGFLKTRDSGYIDQLIEKHRNMLSDELLSGKRTQIGVNKYLKKA